tara:strand:+ start:346 stop:633 length:288 start_codon:yes stop_codon:yes gene_type:complete
MTAQGIYLNISRRNDDLQEMIEEYSEKFNLSKADTVAEILKAYPKLIAYKQKVMSMVRFSITNGSTLEEIASSMGNIQKAVEEISTEQSEDLVNT